MASDWVTVTPAERETVIQFDDASEVVQIGTAQRKTANTLQKRGFKPTRISKSRDGKIHWLQFEVPVNQFRWGFRKKSKPLSDEHKARIAAARQKKEGEE